ncbi:MAG: hypothetical protein AAF385_02630 [Pseudomonadota bacterium]
MSDKNNISERRAREIVEQQIKIQDAATHSALNQARQRALDELDKGWRWPVLLPLAGASAAAVLVTVFMLGREPRLESPGIELAASSQSADDFELLLAEDSFDMLDELEFFELLDGLDEGEDGIG